MIAALQRVQDWLDVTRKIDWLGPLALRLYLAPVFWVAGMNKLHGFPDVVQWFGNPDWGLGLPLPTLMAGLATGTEILGAIALLMGLATRWATLPLIATMIVATTQVHWHNGWQAIHDLQSPFPSPAAGEALQRLAIAKDILREHGNYGWLTEYGNLVVSNNGVEWAVTYLVMLLALLSLGPGRYLSVDYWIARRFGKRALA